MSESRQRLRAGFDSVASGYQQARPDYPAALFDDLVSLAGLGRGDRLLEIGCATGKATRPLLQRGFSVVCVELGEELAAVARHRLDGLPAEVQVGAFESWGGARASFDLVYAATAWHWIDPEVRYPKAHRLLRPAGHLAIWSAGHAFPAGFDPFFTEIQEVYEALGERHEGAWPPPPPELVPDDRPAIEASGLFQDVQVRRYLWETPYTAEQYVALLNTFSGHIAMSDRIRGRLYEEIRGRIRARPDGLIHRHWSAILHVARAVDVSLERAAISPGV